MESILRQVPAANREAVARGITLLKGGGLVAYPTDTIYGLGADIYNAGAVARVYTVKERPQNTGLPVLISRLEQLDDVAVRISAVAGQLAAEFWPGALTLVLYKSSRISDLITAGANTVAVRIPANPIPIALIEGGGAPLIGTSANRHGQAEPLTAQDVEAQLGGKIDLIIDGGRASLGRSSTIIDCTGVVPAILREGAVSRRNIERICEVC